MAERVYCLYRGKNQESILMQKNACHDFTEKKGWNIVGEEQEIDVSGYGRSPGEGLPNGRDPW